MSDINLFVMSQVLNPGSVTSETTSRTPYGTMQPGLIFDFGDEVDKEEPLVAKLFGAEFGNTTPTTSTTSTTSTTTIPRGFHQGPELGNCTGVAIMQAFAAYPEGREYLASLISYDEALEAYIVQFPNRPKTTIPKAIVDRYDSLEGSDEIEAIIFALYKDLGYIDNDGNMHRGNQRDPGRIELYPATSLSQLTGLLEPSRSNASNEALEKIEAMMLSGRKLIMVAGKSTFTENHMYSIVRIDSATQEITVANPWYNNENDAETVTMSFEKFQSDYPNGIYLVEMTKNEAGKIIFLNPDDIVTGNKKMAETTNPEEYIPTENDYRQYFKKLNSDNVVYYTPEETNLSGEDLDKIANKVTDALKKMYKTQRNPINQVLLGYLTSNPPKIPNLNDKNLQPVLEWWLDNYKKIIDYEIQVEHETKS